MMFEIERFTFDEAVLTGTLTTGEQVRISLTDEQRAEIVAAMDRQETMSRIAHQVWQEGV